MSMFFEVIDVTPKMALAWLEYNVENRVIREGHAANLAQEMINGHWRLTHQGIAFNEHGMLKDGQHRLWAVVLAKRTVPMVVAKAVPNDASMVMDRQATRTVSDILKRDHRLCALANAICKIATGTTRSIASDDTMRVLDAFSEEMDLVNSCARSRFVSSAFVRTGVVARLAKYRMENDRPSLDKVISSYRQFCLGDQTMPSAAFQFFKQISATGREDSTEMVARSWNAFDARRPSQTKALLRDTRAAVADVRSIFIKVLSEDFVDSLRIAPRLRLRHPIRKRIAQISRGGAPDMTLIT